MKVLITGGAGYIGSVAALVFRGAGHEVVVLDNLSQSLRSSVPEGVDFIEADVAYLGEALRGHKDVEAVVHLAAFIAAGESMVKPEMYWQNNTAGTLKMLDGLRELGIRKLVFASTAAVYGNPEKVPITEDARLAPVSTYGMTKLAMEMAITSECLAHGLAATTFRFFNVAGSYGASGEHHDPETHIIPLALEAVRAGGKFRLFGDDYPTADGACVRDYIHVADLAQAMLLALDKLEPGKHSIYNLGNGGGFSNKEVVAAVESVTGQKLAVETMPRREGDPAVLVASSDKARKQLGWKPSKPSLEEMIADAWEIVQKQ